MVRVPRRVRQGIGRPPRIVWGNTPLINIKYWSSAARAAGYESQTLVSHFYPANDRRDFDVVRDDWLVDRRWLLPVRDYLLFARVLWSADLLCMFFDGGFLKATPLAAAEVRLLRMAGCKLILVPFGSDIAVRGHLGPTEAGFAVHYPHLLEQSDVIRRRVDRLCRIADLVIKTLQVGYLPRHDAFMPHALAVDTERWRPTGEDEARWPETVVVVHAPNHRQLKGTDAVIAAVEQLREDGLDVRLELLEGRPNEELREIIGEADIAVDQLLTGYGLFAVECMSAGLPVVSNLRWMPAEMRAATSLAAAPIVDADAWDLADHLRELVVDAGLRRRLGRESRRFAVDYHSYEAIGRVWSALFHHVWHGQPLPADLAPLSDRDSATP